MLSCHPRLRYRTEANLVGREDNEFSLGHVDIEASKKNLCVSVCVCWLSRLLVI